MVGKNEVKKVLNVLREDESKMAANWSRRFKNNIEKLRSGDIYQVAEVVRNLSIRERERGLSAGEKRMINKARQILISELIYATGEARRRPSHDRQGARRVARRPRDGGGLRPGSVASTH